MSLLISQVDVLEQLSRLMGKRVTPGGDNSDWTDYIQFAFDYAWRYHRWTFSMATATLSGSPAYMPADFDLDGYREISGVVEVPLDQYAFATSTTGTFAIQWDATNERYQVLGQTNLPVYYQRVPPTLGDGSTASTRAPFPSAMTIALGAVIYSKMGENPTRADVQQEWDLFHAELNRHAARSDRNIPHPRAGNRYSASGVNVGE